VIDWQRWTYEALAPLGPTISAVTAGYAVMIWNELFITPAGEAYLAKLEEEANVTLGCGALVY
jgi:hypothetical protein